MPAFSPAKPFGAFPLVATAPAANFVYLTPAVPGFQYRICNPSNLIAWLSPSDISGDSAMSLASVTGYTIPLLPGTVEVFSFGANPLYLSARTDAGSATIYITPGAGE